MIRHRRWPWLTAAALTALTFFILRNAGRWLIVDEPTGTAQAVVVLGGDTPFRAMEAADVYRERLAPEVWLTKGEFTAADATLREIGVERQPEFEVSRQVLLRLGVPASAIRVLPDETPSTIDEVRVVARELAAQHGARVIFVTSKYHGRRVKNDLGQGDGLGRLSACARIASRSVRPGSLVASHHGCHERLARVVRHPQRPRRVPHGALTVPRLR